ncbi:MAG: hypothetical protein AB3N16_11720 [Flavobacteriaceae bacterium]
MRKKLKEELRKLATDIITSQDFDLPHLHQRAQQLYEKLAVLKFIEEKLNDIEVDVSKNVIASKFETMANAVLNANSSVPENNPHQEDIITPGIETIKGMVSEMPGDTTIDELLQEFLAKPRHMKNDREDVTPTHIPDTANATTPPTKKDAPAPKSLNERLASKNMQIDLNSRLAFVKHLFNGSIEEYNRVLSQLNTIETEERSVAFIKNMVKPEYNHWAGKEEYEERFMEFVERRFS